MKSFSEREAMAKARYTEGLLRAMSNPEPQGQKFPCGARVRIAEDLGPRMRHFISGANATVEYVHAHAYGGSDVKSYSLFVDGHGSCAWYEEWQLSAI